MKLKKYPIDQSPLYKLKSKKRLAEIFSIELKMLITISNSSENYKIFTISKNGKERVVETPKLHLEKIHNRLFRLFRRIEHPGYLHSGVKRKSHVTNALAHVGENELSKIDIKSFFPSTIRNTVYNFYRNRLYCSPDVAEILTKLSCVNNHIPTGSQISQSLAFLANETMFDEINNFSKENGVEFTLYVDDLTFSCKKIPKSFIWNIKKIINKYGYKYHKEFRYSKDKVKLVTGVATDKNEILLRNKHHKSIHELHEKVKQGKIKEKELHSLFGKINSASNINKKYKHYAKQLQGKVQGHLTRASR